MLSVIVCFYNNQREAKNTLYSLTRQYQQVENIDYEVIVLDHGSSLPLSELEVTSYGNEFKYFYIKDAPTSPVKAINKAVRNALGDKIIMMIDGAHIITPGVFNFNLNAYQLSSSPFIVTPSFHLGPKMQNESVLEGYNQDIEDQLLDKAGWRNNGYRLFHITQAFSDGGNGWFGNLFESSCFGMYKNDFLRLGGFNENFISPGGGLVNLDFFKICMQDLSLDFFMLIGEASFHQYHGGIASNAPWENHPWKKFHEEYQNIRGKEYERSFREALYLGSFKSDTIGPLSASITLARQAHYGNK
jgi:glycosyltransferase involved in cell wall biosynthesis